ncbi:6-phosphofructokinase 1 [Candidatus Terasakiella magnetica]|uniref:ATP-dependent 6-phosphofructokinase n=1 Tax=Candidatus Terasakiella magnetica TaxID=1867952 RepID=A0A1C3REP7_9PROT|nr:ATP-dependent 6-phosphofructokinase [Candidatus Terasakiella magnetica]SCA55729.1 6-phosphofructokinase 1 [Candidatus Terasakiella magnetica]
MAKKRIGILTSGGDCAGLNAAIRAVTRRAIDGFGWEVVGIRNGTLGLISEPIEAEILDKQTFSGVLLRQGGTFLGSSTKGDPFAFKMPDGSVKDRSMEFVEGFRSLNLDGLIGIGGDGSMKILNRLCELGDIPFIGIPKTIDNDVALTEFTIGFTTAVNVAVDALDRLLPTAASHHRVMVLEVMGRDAGHIALHAGIAGGADVILLPEIAYDMDKVAEKIRDVYENEKRSHALVVCSEAIKTSQGQTVMHANEEGKMNYGGVGHEIGGQIAKMTGADTRVTVLGHLQRGGTPAMRDRLIASAFGVRAVDLMAQGKTNCMVAWQHREVVDVPLDEVVKRYKKIDVTGTLVHTARGLGICLGD